MTEQKSKGQKLADYFNKILKEDGLPEVPIVKPDRPRVWVGIRPRRTIKSCTKNQSKDSDS